MRNSAWQALTVSPTFSEIPLWEAMEPKGEEGQDLEMLHRPSRQSRSTAHQREDNSPRRQPLAGERRGKLTIGRFLLGGVQGW